jgi:hypothetical protein
MLFLFDQDAVKLFLQGDRKGMPILSITQEGSGNSDF